MRVEVLMATVARSESLEVDLLVVGSGAGGMTAALAAHSRGLRTLVVEKSTKFGGSTALSGGGIWMPGAAALVRDGYAGTEEEAMTYLRALTKGLVPEERLLAYLRMGPAALTFLESLGPRLTFKWKPGYPDYFPKEPGGSVQGRSLNVLRIDLRELGGDLSRLQLGPSIRGFWVTTQELRDLYTLRKTWRGKVVFGKILWRIVRAFFTGERINTLGAALAARLFLAMKDAGIPLWLDSPLTELTTGLDGSVTGAIVTKEGRPVTISARAVLLASGGFDHDLRMRQEFTPELSADWSLGTAEITGDGLKLAQRLGAATDLMDSAWWFPVIDWPDGRLQFLLNERMVPSQFIVNAAGERYVNEAAPYTEFGRAMISGQRTGVSHIPSWMIMDAYTWRHHVIAGHLPIPRIPFAPVPTGLKPPKAWLKEDGAMRAADTLRGLAEKIGVDPDRLEQTAARFNELARRGIDHDFGRGDNPYDNYYGDPTLRNPNLAELRKGPYYAFRIVPGDLGTNGGLVTDEHARVLEEKGEPIPGLYATGNVTASVMGESYAGPGATLGPAMAFGYVAANHLADHLEKS
jgi:3-oxosteroid 1-dehydrogenase